MKQALSGTLAVIALCLVTFALGEGIYAISQWGKPHTSVAYRLYGLLGGGGSATADRSGPPFTWLLDPDRIEALLPQLKANGVGIGNSPFDELQTEKAAMITETDGCLSMKPNLHKSMTLLRSNAFNVFDPMNMFWDSDTTLDPELQALVEDYGIRVITTTTNAYGERITLPAVQREHKVLIGGSSQAMGAMVNDDETLASQLQARDPERQYINTGVGSAGAADTFCQLDLAVARHGGPIDELIYLYSETNFEEEGGYPEPGAALDWLRDFADRNGIDRVTVVYMTRIYNIVPQYTRLRYHYGARARAYNEKRAELAKLAPTRGFRYLDIAEIALTEAERTETQFGALGAFVDHGHLSASGTARLADWLMAE
jgi:hypothetical protein